MHTKEEIYKKVVEILSETFKLDPAVIKPEANLYNELDIDSIDAIDLLVKLQQICSLSSLTTTILSLARRSCSSCSCAVPFAWCGRRVFSGAAHWRTL